MDYEWIIIINIISYSRHCYTVPVEVVFKFVVASKRCHGSGPNRIGEKHLCTSIDPDLKRQLASFVTTMQFSSSTDGLILTQREKETKQKQTTNLNYSTK